MAHATTSRGSSQSVTSCFVCVISPGGLDASCALLSSSLACSARLQLRPFAGVELARFFHTGGCTAAYACTAAWADATACARTAACACTAAWGALQHASAHAMPCRCCRGRGAGDGHPPACTCLLVIGLPMASARQYGPWQLVRTPSLRPLLFCSVKACPFQLGLFVRRATTCSNLAPPSLPARGPPRPTFTNRCVCNWLVICLSAGVFTGLWSVHCTLKHGSSMRRHWVK